ncbi:hypothetical protein BST83_11795 [Polaribacter filamentus]|uniref:DUF218 domain-containing protein n=1 Tax=Polaribacter filamentus TaxID=53483 RepID=A0A2S7KYQ5_9FLAO|nr:YdcF family protein [Polaribacter filamentus]PQB07757.1 hypothetical protein BST83_11795 [Polaribacter filamentus]
MQDRNFYWATLVEKNTTISNLVGKDFELSNFLSLYKDRLNTISNQNDATAAQYAEALKFKVDEITNINVALKKLIEENVTSFKSFSDNHIGVSGAFNQFKEVKNIDRIHQLIVQEMLLGINQIIDTYCAGIAPLYPIIDSVSFDVNSAQFKLLVKNLVTSLNTNKADYKLFYQPFLKFALGVLEINDRDEAGRYFPMREGVNKAAYNYIKTINWADYDYSIIVVLGDSPNSSNDLPNISLGGMARADHAVELYKQNKAPLLVFTGGHLYPVHTPYSEAIEVRKYVMDTYNIPESRLLVDPHSRHTTTNMRNVGRLIFKYNIPIDKKGIISTSNTHSEYVSSNRYPTRSQAEMNHIPVELYNRLSDFDIEFTSLIEVLHLDSSDPLDP